ncbi:zinc finger protein basonuclin-2-like isoform X2 [Apodemus sylvaticus]|uniref:zinc finger protein basonuclin-2-like isoform X2 n=1 Tax=Apodemus sylvaticus TaxID=10129 RepID=UPI0022438851|nr:zinc finger protein basonuclin-2-like isoform X2 [Apodemus sylvaticus]XP_052015965.1 zinc finger protein basonuclin-2-like isoform X2 [Apodemus sylvaticus]
MDYSLLTFPGSAFRRSALTRVSDTASQSEEAEVDVRERDTQRDREPKRARDLTLRDSCTDNSMQFGARTTAAGPGFMGTWQNADTNLLFRMSQQATCHYTVKRDSEGAARWSSPQTDWSQLRRQRF